MEMLYSYLGKLGYAHPIHAPLTHVPLGMVIGAFVFILAARMTRNTSFLSTARHCTALALVSVFPTAFLGYMDWQHYYAGAWLPQIEKKILLAAVLTLSLAATLIALRRERSSRSLPVVFVLVNLLVAGGLGYFGGELVFNQLTPKKSVDSLTIQQGGELYNQFCAACHPNGGNALKAHLPLRQAPQLGSFDSFVGYLRSPKARDGSATLMPAFPEEKLSKAQVNGIYQFVLTDLAGPKN